MKLTLALILTMGLAFRPALAAKPTAAPAKPNVKAQGSTPHPLQRILKGFWDEQDEDQVQWDFQPGKANKGTLVIWTREISYKKHPYILKGKNQIFLPDVRTTFTAKFDRGMMTLTSGKEMKRYKRVS